MVGYGKKYLLEAVHLLSRDAQLKLIHILQHYTGVSGVG
jgi:hypothetical protein